MSKKKKPDTKLDFRGTVLELWQACGDRKSWDTGLTDRLAKTLMWIACNHREPVGWSQATFEAAMDNYSRRAVLLGRLGFGS